LAIQIWLNIANGTKNLELPEKVNISIEGHFIMLNKHFYKIDVKPKFYEIITRYQFRFKISDIKLIIISLV